MYRISPTRSLTFIRKSTHLHYTNSDASKRKHNYTSRARWPLTNNPTPYDILGTQRGKKYLKAGYYDLVKTYHPDLNMASSRESLSKEERVERYRLVVAAHEILSDPQKRAAYDVYGIGWGAPSNCSRGSDRTTAPFTNRRRTYSWEYGDHASSEFDIWGFLSTHKYIIRLVAVIFIFGDACLFLVTLSKAEVELERLDMELRKLMLHRQERSLGAPSSVLQLERFFLKRDPSGMGVLPGEESSYREILPLCMY
jgi:curved DNA-binding protein CbpA